MKKRSNHSSQHFDEMQERLRADGYKRAYFSLIATIGGICIYNTVSDQTIPNFILSSILIASLMISLMVFGLYCIKNDSFFFIGQNWKAYFGLCLIVGVVHIVNAVSVIAPLAKTTEHSGVLFEGYISRIISSGFMAITFFTLAIAIAVKMFWNSNSKED